ncbi:MAG: hypothetical protein ACMUIA_05195 [bacterium]
MRRSPHNRPPAWMLSCLLFLVVFLSPLFPASSEAEGIEKAYELGGHFKSSLAAFWPHSESILNQGEREVLWNYRSELRMKGCYILNDWSEFEVHSESIYLSSETRRRILQLQKDGPGWSPQYLGFPEEADDTSRLMDLTLTTEKGNHQVIINRLDRLSLILSPRWGMITIGRQAISWGHGFLFHPMDIFAPFPPAALDRDYKRGEDALLGQIHVTRPNSEMQFLYIPRRDIEGRNIRWADSSLAGRYHFFLPGTEAEMTLLAGVHYEDTIMGIGNVGYLGKAAWRFDLTLTNLHEKGDTFISSVINLDSAWDWWGVHCYGWIEYYYNGLGRAARDYARAMTQEALRERLDRQELFVCGRHYLDTQIKVEFHPLVHFFFHTVTNIADPSGYVQPWLVWDMTANTKVNLASTHSWGETGTEFGGVRVDWTPFTSRRPDEVSLWITLFF